MQTESTLGSWIRFGGKSAITVATGRAAKLEAKFTVAPDRLLESILDDALAEAVHRLNGFLPQGSSVNIANTDLSDIRDALADIVASRIGDVGLPLQTNDPVISDLVTRFAEHLSARLQTDTLQTTEYIWRSRDDDRVRGIHRDYDDHVFFWAETPAGGHPGDAINCRCHSEPVLPEMLPEGATCDILTGSRLANIFPDADADLLDAIAREMDVQIVNGKIDTPARLAHFIGQAMQEIGDEARLEEGFNYRASRLSIFEYFRMHPEDAEIYGRTDDHEADREMIANLAYANSNGNGDAASGDGWRFRGRGLFHLTGRANYRAFTNAYREMFGEDVDFEEHPDLVSESRYAVRSALYFWVAHGLFELANGGVTEEVSNRISRFINRNELTYPERWSHVEAVNAGGQLAGICRFSVARPRFEDQ